MKTSSLEFSMLLDKLMKACIKEDKKAIISCYDLAKEFDLEKINNRLYKQYEKLVDKGNEILGF